MCLSSHIGDGADDNLRGSPVIPYTHEYKWAQGGFMVFFLVFLITLCVGVVIAYFVAAISPDMEVANAALPAYVVTLLFFTGKSL